MEQYSYLRFVTKLSLLIIIFFSLSCRTRGQLIGGVPAAQGLVNGPPLFNGSTSSTLANNLFAGSNSNVNTSYRGTPSTFYAVDGSNNVTITVANSFGTTAGTILGISGCTVATFLNGLHLITNSSTSNTAIVGPVYNSQGTQVTHGTVSTTAETSCHLIGQGQQAFLIAPMPFVGSGSCPLGNGSVGCAVGTGVNTWGFDWSTPGDAINTAPNNCITQLTDSVAFTKSWQPSTSGENSDRNTSLSDLGSPLGFFITMENGSSRIGHVHINPTLCNGLPGIVMDTVTEASLYNTTFGSGFRGGFSRKFANRPGANQALRYYIDNTVAMSQVLKSIVLTYAAGTITGGTPTTIFNYNACPGWNNSANSVSFNGSGQFGVSNDDNVIVAGWGVGNQGSIGKHNILAINIANNTCTNWDTAGFAGTGVTIPGTGSLWGGFLPLVPNPGSGSGSGYAVNDILILSCGATAKVTALGTSNSVKTVAVQTAGSNCVVGAANTTTGGSGSGALLDIDSIGQPGLWSVVYPPCSPGPTCSSEAPVTPTVTYSPNNASGGNIASFGLHSSGEDASGLYAHVSGWNTTQGTGQGQAPCNNCLYNFLSIGTTTVSVQTDNRLGGHPAIGYGYYGIAQNPNYTTVKLPDVQCTITTDCVVLYSGLGISPTTQNHSGWPTPNNDNSYYIYVTSAFNVLPNTWNNPVGWSGPFGLSMYGINTAGAFKWFRKFYDAPFGTNKTEVFQAAFQIIDKEPQANFILSVEDGYCNVPGNTAFGLDNTSNCYAAMMATMTQ